MNSQKLTFVTKRSKLSYDIHNGDQCNLIERRIPRTFIEKESSTIFNFLEDFPNEDFELPLPFDATEEEIDLLFYFITVYSWEIFPKKYYSEYFINKPDFWSDAYKKAKLNEFKGYSFINGIDQLERYILNFLSFEFDGKDLGSVYYFNLSRLCKEKFDHCFSLDIRDPFKLKLLCDLHDYYLQIKGRTTYIDRDVLNFLNNFERVQKNVHNINYDEDENLINIWNNPVLYLVADFCGFDSFVSFFENISFYKKWTERQKLIASKNINFFTRFACIPYFLESFGKSEEDAKQIAKILYEDGESGVRKYIARTLIHNTDFDGDQTIFIPFPRSHYFNDRILMGYRMLEPELNIHFGELIMPIKIYNRIFYKKLIDFLKNEPLIAKLTLQNLDLETKLFLESITFMKSEIMALVLFCNYKTIQILLEEMDYFNLKHTFSLRNPKVYHDPPKRIFVKQHPKKVFRHPGGR